MQNEGYGNTTLGKQISSHVRVLTLLVLTAAVPAARIHGQATQSTADRPIAFSFFAGGTTSFTGIQGVKNYGITGGMDVRLKQYAGFRPAVEVRGFYPVDSNSLVNHRDILAGVRIERAFGPFLPYVDGLFGRSSLHYNPYLPSPDGSFAYTRTSSNVYSPGGGLEYSLSPHYALKGDVQYQRFSTPVTDTGHVFATTVTLGVTYHLFGGEAPR